ncbi:MAG: ribonuclease P protein component [Salibacteraceae bacterium]
MNAERYTFPSNERLKHKKLFEALFASSNRTLKHPVLALWKEVEPENNVPLQVGFSVPKKHYKTAVERNQIKRWMREAYRKESHALKTALKGNGKKIVLLFIVLKADNKTYEGFAPKIALLLRSIEQKIANVG